MPAKLRDWKRGINSYIHPMLALLNCNLLSRAEEARWAGLPTRSSARCGGDKKVVRVQSKAPITPQPYPRCL